MMAVAAGDVLMARMIENNIHAPCGTSVQKNRLVQVFQVGAARGGGCEKSGKNQRQAQDKRRNPRSDPRRDLFKIIQVKII